MVAQALHSHPAIVCFREVFNGRLDNVNFGVEGYNDFSERDLASRQEDPVRFLNERIFRGWPPDVRAVGFKLHYTQHWDFPGIIEHLAQDRELRVIHLRRRNMLRSFVSMKIAAQTGAWVDTGRPTLTPANASRALRNPTKAARRVSDRLKQLDKQPIVITAEEYGTFVLKTRLRQEGYTRLFRGHPTIDVDYEDVVALAGTAFARVFAFLAVEPAPLSITLRRQNPESLRDLIENYDELRAAFEGTPEAALFDD